MSKARATGSLLVESFNKALRSTTTGKKKAIRKLISHISLLLQIACFEEFLFCTWKTLFGMFRSSTLKANAKCFEMNFLSRAFEITLSFPPRNWRIFAYARLSMRNYARFPIDMFDLPSSLRDGKARASDKLPTNWIPLFQYCLKLAFAFSLLSFFLI